ncbi:MAG: DUF11 domain-containing protein, partial [Anaerolineae bacterium]|nr:DUF11 domain-containing protein [Anaerolineae bacterium]
MVNHEPEDKYIEQVMRSLAQDRIKPAPGFKRRLSANLKEELQSSKWRFSLFLRWAYVAAVVILLAWSFTLKSPERALLTVHKGAAQVSSPRAAILWWLREDSAVGATQSQSIVVGGKIGLSEDSQALLSFFDGSILELFPGSQLEVVKAQPQFAWQPVNVQVKLLAGGVSANVSQMPDPKQRFEIDTAAAMINARDAAFQVHIVAQDQTYVATESGFVNVTLDDPARGNSSVDVPAGYEVDAIPGQPLIVRPVSSGPPGPVISSSMQPGTGIASSTSVPSSGLQTSQELTDLVAVGGVQNPDVVSPTVSAITNSMPLPAWFVSPVVPEVINVATSTVTVPEATGISSGTGIMTGTPSNSVSQGWADLHVSVVANPDPAPVGGELKYVIVVTNLGPDVARDIVLTGTLPSAVTFVAATTGYQRTSSRLIWGLGTLGADTSKILTVTARVRSWASKRFTSTVEVTSVTQDDDLTNNSAAVSSNLSRDIDLTVSTTASPPVIISGDVVTYTIDYMNYGPARAQLVDIVAALPPEVRFG